MDVDLFVNLVSNNIEEILDLSILKDNDFTKKTFQSDN